MILDFLINSLAPYRGRGNLKLVAGILSFLSITVSASHLTQQAETAWQHRDQPGQTEAAIKAWESAIQEESGKAELYIPLIKAIGRAYRHSKGQEKERWADQGRKYGELAVQKNPTKPEAFAHYGEALGQWAQAHKGVGSLKVVKEAVKNLEQAVALNPRYAYAHMLLAQFYENSPGLLSVGDKEKALEHAKLAVESGGGYAINRLTLAKLYIARDNKTAAKEQLEKAIALPAPADAIPETRSDQADAQELLKKL